VTGQHDPALPRTRRRPGARGAHLQYVPEDYFRRLVIADIFPREGPLEIDLGCGDGSFLVAMAQRYPDKNFLGTERLLGRVRSTCWKADVAGVSNVRLLRVESAYAIQYLLPVSSVSRFYVMFPDPWPKRRHWPRRLIQTEFLQSAAVGLVSGGELCVKTDDVNYFSYIERIVAACPLFTRHPWDEDVPYTDFERHYVAQGRTFHSLRLVKR
jgi:tRNA (guanine-N7-)-methyltransferase